MAWHDQKFGCAISYKESLKSIQNKNACYHTGGSLTENPLRHSRPPWTATPPVNRITDRYKNITFPQLLTGGNNYTNVWNNIYLYGLFANISSNVNCIFSDKPIVEEEGRIYVNDANALIINTTKEDDGGKSFVSKYTCWVRFSKVIIS